ncbi:hypothetical protein BH09BAC5_BH09BAC5_22350 [soil metagenome]
MKKIISLFVFAGQFCSCTTKPVISDELNMQYESCRKVILDNQIDFIGSANTQERKDSLTAYVEDLKQNNLAQLIQKYEVEQEEYNMLVYSVCEKAEALKPGPSVEQTMKTADSMMRALDSIMVQDSLNQLKK